MRVDIGYKFIISIVVVVGTTVLVDRLVPFLLIAPQWRHLFSITVALVIGLILGSLFSRSFSRNVRFLTGAAQKLAQGDLRQNIRLRRTLTEDETADIAAALDHVATSLRQMVSSIHGSATQVAGSAQNLSATAEEMSASAMEIAHAAEQISIGAEKEMGQVENATASIRRIAEEVEHIAASAREVEEATSQTLDAAERGGKMVQPNVERLKRAFDEVERSGHQMLSFSVHMQQIGKISEVITGVAEKTGLLALNATIEATRAGEFGQGFAVLAEEIGKLSDSTAASAADIADLIRTLQQESISVQGTMNRSIGEIEMGRTALDATSDLFASIIGTASESRRRAALITSFAEKQAEGTQVMVAAIDDISQIIHANAASTEEVSSATMQQSGSMEMLSDAAQALNILANTLMELVEHFTVEDQDGGYSL